MKAASLRWGIINIVWLVCVFSYRLGVTKREANVYESTDCIYSVNVIQWQYDGIVKFVLSSCSLIRMQDRTEWLKLKLKTNSTITKITLVIPF